MDLAINLYKKIKDILLEWYRLYFHTLAVTILILFNMTFLLYNSTLSYISIITTNNIDINFFDLTQISWPLYFILLNTPLFTWFYSTITQSIKRGHKVIIDWSKTKKGRIFAAVFCAIPFIVLAWLGFARYARETYAPFLSSITVEAEFLAVSNLNSLIKLIYLLPALITPFIMSVIAGEFIKKKTLQKQFFEWESPLLAKHSFNLKENSCDVIIGWDKKTKKPIVLKEKERFLHELVVGPTGSGKTSTSILPRIAMDLVRIARGQKCSVILIEPKGDAVADVLKIAKELKIPDHIIKVIDPTSKQSIKFNPFFGDMTAAAESFRGTLNALTGDQDEFFKGQQEETAALFTMLAKIRFGDLTNIGHIQRMYTEPRYLANITEQVREEVNKLKAREHELTQEQKRIVEQYDRVVSYFENEVLEYKFYTDRQGNRVPRLYEHGPYRGQQEVENKKDKFVTGAKKYLNDITMNAMLTDLMIAEGDDEVLNLDEFLDKGGILLINTELGQLEELSILLGQFMIRQIQSAVFRRPREVNGYKRIPTFLYIDEFSLYVNENFERLLTLGRSYKVGTLIALQSLGQLNRIVPGYRETIMANASTKTVFGRGVYEDNLAFSRQFGEEEQVEESINESTSPMTEESVGWGFRYNTQRKLMPRFTPTQIQELEFKHCIVQSVKEDGSIGVATLAVGMFVNETNILKKFVDIDKLDLSTKEHKELNLSNVERYMSHSSILNEIEELNNTDLPASSSEETDESSIAAELPEEEFTLEDVNINNEDIKFDETFDIDESEEKFSPPEQFVDNYIDTTIEEEQADDLNTDSIIDSLEVEHMDEELQKVLKSVTEDVGSQDDIAEFNQINDTNDDNSREKVTVSPLVQHKQLAFEFPEEDMNIDIETDLFEQSKPTSDMEKSIKELLEQTSLTKEENDNKTKEEKTTKKYNATHENKIPMKIDVVEEDDL